MTIKRKVGKKLNKIVVEKIRVLYVLNNSKVTKNPSLLFVQMMNMANF